MDCTCDMIWLRAWYQETDSLTHYPGPRCRDGSMLRESRLSRSECLTSSSADRQSSQQIPLTNEHGDVFQRRVGSEFNECELDESQYQEDASSLAGAGSVVSTNLPPLPGESEYFYDQYIDYPLNDSVNGSQPSPVMFEGPPGVNLSNTILNYNKHKQQQQFFQQQQQGPGSQFTFFGMPLPSLNVGNLWNFGRNANTRATSGTNGKARVQQYRPGEIELFKHLNRKPSRFDHPASIVTIRPSADEMIPRSPIVGPKSPSSGAIDAANRNDNRYLYRPYFQTSFPPVPPPVAEVEKGGFRPIVAETSGGFLPIINPYVDKSNVDKSQERPQNDQAASTVVSESESRWPIPFPSGSRRTGTLPITTTTTEIQETIETTTSFLGQIKHDVEPIKKSMRPDAVVLEVQPTTTTLSPLQNYLADMNAGSKYEETELTTIVAKIDEETSTIASTTSTTTEKPIISQKEAYVVPQTDPWDNLNHSPSSLSALVAPGAQLGIYRSPPGRSTITKVFSSTQTPMAEEYHRTTSSLHQPDVSSDSIHRITTTISPIATTISSGAKNPTSTHQPVRRIDPNHNVDNSAGGVLDNDDHDDGAKTKRKSNMDWYYANYNKTTVDDHHFDPGVNRLRSAVGSSSSARSNRVVWTGLILLVTSALLIV